MAANPEMLRLARQRKGFQQNEAAKLLAVEQPQLSRMENGILDIRDEFLEKAARVYDVPVSFFAQQDTVFGAPVSVHPMWRRKMDVTARELDCTIAELNIRVMHIRRFLEGVGVANTSDLPRLDIEDYSDPAKVAGLVRAHWKLPGGPIKNLTALVEKAGVIVVHSALGGASISGVRFSVPGMPTLIALNSDQPADRMRFTLAHELGHLVMHRFPSPDMEREANDFAAALLMPANDVRPYFLGKKIDLSTLAALKPEWRVSMGGLLMAAHRAGAVDDGRYRYLWKVMSMKGYRLREPVELDFAQEQPTVLKAIVEMHSTALGYSRENLKQILHCNDTDLDAFYGRADSDDAKRPRFTIMK
jgi:Zn-dependent peptidase ImmA (M78 family)/transcriptional regulator with XRE-family HTH domain